MKTYPFLITSILQKVHQFIDGTSASLHLTFFNVNIYHTADSILIYFCSFAPGNSPAQLNICFMKMIFIFQTKGFLYIHKGKMRSYLTPRFIKKNQRIYTLFDHRQLTSSGTFKFLYNYI